MERPYRDDEERQRNRVIKALREAEKAVWDGDLEAAVQFVLDIETEYNELYRMVTEFDDDQAWEDAQ